jgi:hypothetical protein
MFSTQIARRLATALCLLEYKPKVSILGVDVSGTAMAFRLHGSHLPKATGIACGRSLYSITHRKRSRYVRSFIRNNVKFDISTHSSIRFRIGQEVYKQGTIENARRVRGHPTYRHFPHDGAWVPPHNHPQRMAADYRHSVASWQFLDLVQRSFYLLKLNLDFEQGPSMLLRLFEIFLLAT